MPALVVLKLTLARTKLAPIGLDGLRAVGVSRAGGALGVPRHIPPQDPDAVV